MHNDGMAVQFKNKQKKWCKSEYEDLWRIDQNCWFCLNRRDSKWFVKEANPKAGPNLCLQGEKISFQWNKAACLQSNLEADFEKLPDSIYWTEEISLKSYWSLSGWMGQGRFYIFTPVSLLRRALCPNCAKRITIMWKNLYTLRNRVSNLCLDLILLF